MAEHVNCLLVMYIAWQYPINSCSVSFGKWDVIFILNQWWINWKDGTQRLHIIHHWTSVCRGPAALTKLLVLQFPRTKFWPECEETYLVVQLMVWFKCERVMRARRRLHRFGVKKILEYTLNFLMSVYNLNTYINLSGSVNIILCFCIRNMLKLLWILLYFSIFF